MDVEFKGLDKLQKKLDHMAAEAQKLDGDNSVSVTELMPPSFMAHHTKSTSIESFLGDLGVTDKLSFEKLPQETLEDKVKSETDFDSWHDMNQAAVNLYVKNRLGL